MEGGEGEEPLSSSLQSPAVTPAAAPTAASAPSLRDTLLAVFGTKVTHVPASGHSASAHHSVLHTCRSPPPPHPAYMLDLSPIYPPRLWRPSSAPPPFWVPHKHLPPGDSVSASLQPSAAHPSLPQPSTFVPHLPPLILSGGGHTAAAGL